MAETPSSSKDPVERLKAAWESGKYSDLVITCGGEEYNVHKVVVCTGCVFFANAIRFPGTESAENKIDLPDDEPILIKYLVEFLYTHNYDPKTQTGAPTIGDKFTINRTATHVVEVPLYVLEYERPHRCADPFCRSDICPHHSCDPFDRTCSNFICAKCCTLTEDKSLPEHMSLHAKMYALGQKYQVKGLQEVAKARFEAACKKCWSDTKELSRAGWIVLNTTDESMRKVLAETISSHMEIYRTDEVMELLQESNELCLDIIMTKDKEYGWSGKA